MSNRCRGKGLYEYNRCPIEDAMNVSKLGGRGQPVCSPIPSFRYLLENPIYDFNKNITSRGSENRNSNRVGVVGEAETVVQLA